MRRAALSVGGARRLRDLLGVGSSQIAGWLTGDKEPPPAVFLRALELILDELERRP